MDSLPPLVILIVTSFLVLLAIELGFRIGVWQSRAMRIDSEALLSSMTGAHLALLAFIMAFSFSLAANHYSTRNELVLMEANAIAGAYRYAGLLEDDQRDKFRVLIRDYLAIRVTIADRYHFQPQQIIAASEELLEAIWKECEHLGLQRTDLEYQIFQSVDTLFQLHERRASAGFNRIPNLIWITLFVLLMLSMLGIGHFSGVKGRRNPISSTVLALCFSIVLYLVSDLDRPTTGMVVVDHSPILKLGHRLGLDM